MSQGHSITLRLFRYDPGRDSAPTFKEYAVSYDEHTTVLDLLEYVNEYEEPFAFQRECRLFKCGSCGVNVNGQPCLACKKRVHEFTDRDVFVVEPLTCFPLIKDLLVDFSADLEQRSRLRPFPEAASAGIYDSSPTTKECEGLRDYTSCIRCAICVEICSKAEKNRQERVNPLHLLDLARLALDPRDRADRLLQALGEGIRGCNGCQECNAACPVGLDVFGLSVGRLREMMRLRGVI